MIESDPWTIDEVARIAGVTVESIIRAQHRALLKRLRRRAYTAAPTINANGTSTASDACRRNL